MGCWYGRLEAGTSIPLTFATTSLPLACRSTSLQKVTANSSVYSAPVQSYFGVCTSVGYLQISNLDINMILSSELMLKQDHEFKFRSAVLGQHLVAGGWHLILVLLVVECGQNVLGHATLS